MFDGLLTCLTPMLADASAGTRVVRARPAPPPSLPPAVPPLSPLQPININHNARTDQSPDAWSDIVAAKKARAAASAAAAKRAEAVAQKAEAALREGMTANASSFMSSTTSSRAVASTLQDRLLSTGYGMTPRSPSSTPRSPSGTPRSPGRRHASPAHKSRATNNNNENSQPSNNNNLMTLKEAEARAAGSRLADHPFHQELSELPKQGAFEPIAPAQRKLYSYLEEEEEQAALARAKAIERVKAAKEVQRLKKEEEERQIIKPKNLKDFMLEDRAAKAAAEQEAREEEAERIRLAKIEAEEERRRKSESAMGKTEASRRRLARERVERGVEEQKRRMEYKLEMKRRMALSSAAKTVRNSGNATGK